MAGPPCRLRLLSVALAAAVLLPLRLAADTTAAEPGPEPEPVAGRDTPPLGHCGGGIRLPSLDWIPRAVNTERYDLLNNTAWEAVAAGCQQQYERTGVCLLEGFFRPAFVAAVRADLAARQPSLSDKHHTVFQLPPDDALPPSHPRNRMVHAKIGFLGRQRLGEEHPVVRLYRDSSLIDFLAQSVDTVLYESADPQGSVYATVNGDEHITAWHLDQSPFSAVMLVQAAESGSGRFQYVPNATAGGEAATYERVGRLLDGTLPVREIQPSPGALFLFRGETTLHQVSMVAGARPRISAVFTFTGQPSRGSAAAGGPQGAGGRHGFRNSDLVHEQNNWAG